MSEAKPTELLQSCVECGHRDRVDGICQELILGPVPLGGMVYCGCACVVFPDDSTRTPSPAQAEPHVCVSLTDAIEAVRDYFGGLLAMHVNRDELLSHLESLQGKAPEPEPRTAEAIVKFCESTAFPFNEKVAYVQQALWLLESVAVPEGKAPVGEREQILDRIIANMPESWRDRWCEPGPMGCGCLGCANGSGHLVNYGFTKEEWAASRARTAATTPSSGEEE